MGNQSHQVSASWLDRLEREDHELTVNKLIALADIYNVPTEQLIRTVHPENTRPAFLRELSSANAPMLLTEDPLEQQAKYLLPETLIRDQAPEETTLHAADKAQFLAPYRRGAIGKRDLTLDPMIVCPTMTLWVIPLWLRHCPIHRNGCDEQLKRSVGIVEGTFVPGASIARVAREYGVNANQVFQVRYEYRKGN